MLYTTFTNDLRVHFLQSSSDRRIELALKRLAQTGNVGDGSALFESLRLLLPTNCRSEYTLINGYAKGLKGRIRKELAPRCPITLHDAKETSHRAEMIDDTDITYSNRPRQGSHSRRSRRDGDRQTTSLVKQDYVTTLHPMTIKEPLMAKRREFLTKSANHRQIEIIVTQWGPYEYGFRRPR